MRNYQGEEAGWELLIHLEKWSLKRGLVSDYKYIGQIGGKKEEKDYLN